MLSVIKIKDFNENKATGLLLQKVFNIFYEDFSDKIITLIGKYSPTRLHNTRVAARRLEALLVGFKKFINIENTAKYKYGYEYTLDSIKKIIKLLGASREYEVTYDLTLKYINSNESGNHKNLLLFLCDLRNNKNLLIKNLYKNNYFLKYKSNLKRIYKYINEYLLIDVPVEKLITPFGKIYCIILLEYFTSFLKRIKKLNLFNLKNSQQVSTEKLHKFRINTKAFRYMLDMCTGLFSSEFENFRVNIKNIVEKLGEYHDLDVVINCIEKFLVEKISLTELSSKPFNDYLRYSLKIKEKIFWEIISLLKSIDENQLNRIKNCEIFLRQPVIK